MQTVAQRIAGRQIKHAALHLDLQLPREHHKMVLLPRHRGCLVAQNGARWQLAFQHFARQSGAPRRARLLHALAMPALLTLLYIRCILQGVNLARYHSLMLSHDQGNIDFFMAFTESYPDVNWRVVENPIFVAYCAIGVSQGNENLTEVLNIALFDLHSSGMVNETWEKHYGAPMLRTVEPTPFF